LLLFFFLKSLDLLFTDLLAQTLISLDIWIILEELDLFQANSYTYGKAAQALLSKNQCYCPAINIY
jgi:hypothetical protein